MGRGHFRNVLSPAKKNTADECPLAGVKKYATATSQESSGVPGAKMDLELSSKPEPSETKSDVLEKKTAAPEVDGGLQTESITDGSQCDEKKLEPVPVVFDDVTVCRYLKIRRRVLDGARTQSARGRDWDCVDLHAGMTKAWIDAYALDKHIMPNFAIKLEPIKAGDGVASVRLIGTHPNLEMCAVEKLADGSRCFAHVRNLLKFPIHFHEGFDCRVIGNRLEWVYNLNEVAY